MDTDKPVISLVKMSKRFGRRTVLREIDVDIQSGEFLLLLGNNGAGKSTMLKILSTLMRPSAGDILFRGESYQRAAESVRAAMGMISHESRFYQDLSARENLKIYGTLYRVANLGERIEQSLKATNLATVMDVPVRTFSSGMLKRLALARLQLYDPVVLLLDEPYSGLDQDSIGLMDTYLARFKERGGTTILVTHQFTNGVALCDRILIVDHGRVVYHEKENNADAVRCTHLLQTHTALPGAEAPRGR